MRPPMAVRTFRFVVPVPFDRERWDRFCRGPPIRRNNCKPRKRKFPTAICVRPQSIARNSVQHLTVSEVLLLYSTATYLRDTPPATRSTHAATRQNVQPVATTVQSRERVCSKYGRPCVRVYCTMLPMLAAGPPVRPLQIELHGSRHCMASSAIHSRPPLRPKAVRNAQNRGPARARTVTVSENPRRQYGG